MTRKFGRNYRLTIYPLDGGEPILITMPFTVRFSLTRDINSVANPMAIEVYNLSEINRRRIFQDWFDVAPELDGNGNPVYNADGRLRSWHNIVLEMGYDTLYRVYDGRMTFASSAREGANIVTRIQATDGMLSFAGTQTFQTLESGQTLADVMKFLVGEFNVSGLELGAMGELPEVFNRPVTLNGNTWELLKQYSAGQVYVDGGRIYVLKNNEALDVNHVVNDATGLLETPRREQDCLYISMLLEAGINVGEMVKLESTIMPEYNGEYKVIGVTHRGTISAAVSEEAVTRLQLLAPNLFGGFTRINPSGGAS